MDGPRVIMLSEISQRKTLLLSLTCGILEVKHEHNKDRYREQTSGYQWEVGRSKTGRA